MKRRGGSSVELVIEWLPIRHGWRLRVGPAREELGDKLFFASIRRYLKDQRESAVETVKRNHLVFQEPVPHRWMVAGHPQRRFGSVLRGTASCPSPSFRAGR